MARTIIVVTEDDLEGGSASQQVLFSVDGVEYEIDLNDRNADTFRQALAPYQSHGRRVGGRQLRPTRGRNSAEFLREVRSWGRLNGHTISDRGRVPKSILDAYAEAH